MGDTEESNKEETKKEEEGKTHDHQLFIADIWPELDRMASNKSHNLSEWRALVKRSRVAEKVLQATGLSIETIEHKETEAAIKMMRMGFDTSHLHGQINRCV